VAVVGQVKNENMDPDGLASRKALSFGSIRPSFGRSSVHVPHPIKVARGEGTFFSHLVLGVLIGFESVHYRILYAGRQ
jgi:hypothetical protein